jgi:hypothetical protein
MDGCSMPRARCTPAGSSAIAAPLRSAGVDPADAEAYGVTAVAALEGALVLSRAQRSTRPLEQVGAQLRSSVRALLGSR